MRAYGRLAFLLTLNTIVMFLLTIAFVERAEHVHLNLSNFYMALLMAAPMAALMLVGMGAMFPAKRLNVVLLVGFAILFGGVWWLGRAQAVQTGEKGNGLDRQHG